MKNLNIPATDTPILSIYNIDTVFCFNDRLPTAHEIVKVITNIDVHKSSCVNGISARFCKEAMLAVPDKVCSMITNSLCTGKIPSEWTMGIISVLPKGGDLSYPGNWRPITQTIQVS